MGALTTMATQRLVRGHTPRQTARNAVLYWTTHLSPATLDRLTWHDQARLESVILEAIQLDAAHYRAGHRG